MSRAESRRLVDHHGRFDLLVARAGVVVEEVVDQRTLQLGTLSFIDRKTGACDLHTQVEVDQVIFLRQFPVGQRVFRQLRFHSAHLFHLIIIGANTFGHFIIRDIRDCVKQVLHIFSRLIHFCLDRLVSLLDLGNTLLGSLGLLLFTFFHQHADGFRSGVHLCQVLI